MKLQDKQLLAKLSARDLIAQDAQYHLHCLISLYNRATETKPSDNFDVYTVNEGIAFAELVSYTEDSRMYALVALVFKLTDLVNLFSTRLKQLGTDVVGRIHSTKLKDRILSNFLDMEAHKKGRDVHVVLIFNADIGSALSKACEHDSYVVSARRAAEDAASASRLPCSALLFVCAVDFVLTDLLTPTANNSFWHDY